MSETEKQDSSLYELLFPLSGLPELYAELKEEFDSLSEDVEPLSGFRDKLAAEIEKFQDVFNQALAKANGKIEDDKVAGISERQVRRTLNGSLNLLNKEGDTLFSLLKEVESKLPEPEPEVVSEPEAEEEPAGPTQAELVAQAVAKLEENRAEMDPKTTQIFDLILAAMNADKGEKSNPSEKSKKKASKELTQEEEDSAEVAEKKDGKRILLTKIKRSAAEGRLKLSALLSKEKKVDLQSSEDIKRALKSIGSEAELENAITDILAGGEGVMSLKNNEKRKDILAFALFLKNEGLIGDYAEVLKMASFEAEEENDELDQDEIETRAVTLKKLYAKENSSFKTYVQGRSGYFAKALGSVPAAEAASDIPAEPDAVASDTPEEVATEEEQSEDSADGDAAEAEEAKVEDLGEIEIPASDD